MSVTQESFTIQRYLRYPSTHDLNFRSMIAESDDGRMSGPQESLTNQRTFTSPSSHDLHTGSIDGCHSRVNGQLGSLTHHGNLLLIL